jgi:hypothetical protein
MEIQTSESLKGTSVVDKEVTVREAFSETSEGFSGSLSVHERMVG